MRKNNSTKNFLSTIIPFFIISILGFWRVQVFISNLGEELFAATQLFFQVFAYLSFVEAGIGVLTVQKYYKYLIDNDIEKINQLYTLSIASFRKISTWMLGIGIAISFFLKYLTNNQISLSYLQFIFILFIIKNIVDYLMFAPRLILQADQKMYRVNILINIFKAFQVLIEIFMLMQKYNYIYVLIFQIIATVITNFYINSLVFKEYPWLKTTEKYDSTLLSDTKYVIAHKISGTVYSNTDIMVLSAFLTPILVTIYASYNYIIKFIFDVITTFVQAITASLGHAMFAEDDRNKRIIFEEINSLFFFIAAFFIAALYLSINKFILLWLGKKYLLSSLALIFMLLLLYHNTARRTLLMARDIYGWFKETQLIAICEAIINVIFSLYLVIVMGLPGVVLATIIATITTNFWFYPIFIYKKLFNTKPIGYYVRYFLNLILSILIVFTLTFFDKYFVVNNYIEWFIISLLYSIIILIILFVVNYVLFKEFRSLVLKIKLIFIRKGSMKDVIKV